MTLYDRMSEYVGYIKTNNGMQWYNFTKPITQFEAAKVI